VPAQAPEVQLDALDKAHFRLIGKDVPRVDVAGKTNGSAQYSIDVQVPGMVYGAILREPVDRAQPVQIDDREARAVAGVLQIVPLQYGVGVIAESPCRLSRKQSGSAECNYPPPRSCSMTTRPST